MINPGNEANLEQSADAQRHLECQNSISPLVNPARYTFPDPSEALTEPNGLLAVGGDLHPDRIVSAYQQGIFPWYSDGQPILWWSPDPRMVLFPEKLRISRSLRKVLRHQPFTVTADTVFSQVMQACAAPRLQHRGTWITEEMVCAYSELHQRGIAHSIETWHQGELVGGLYGLRLGQVFFGESMFSRRRDASKVALAYLTTFLDGQGVRMIDCQQETPHLASLGAAPIPRQEFIRQLKNWVTLKTPYTMWKEGFSTSKWADW